jgi:SM-20-related protein
LDKIDGFDSGASVIDFEGPLPRFARVSDFLAETEAARLFDWAIATADNFQPATVGEGRSRVDPGQRIGLTSAKLGPIEAILRERLLGALPELMDATGTSGPLPSYLELQLAAHGDGAFYGPHLDMPVGAGRTATSDRRDDRVLSAVYYFHAEPQRFSGGHLRLFRFGQVPAVQESQEAKHVDIEPVRNSLVAFPSWVPHEVRPIRVPSGDFRDYRFALNCWYCRAIAPALETA